MSAEILVRFERGIVTETRWSRGLLESRMERGDGVYALNDFAQNGLLDDSSVDSKKQANLLWKNVSKILPKLLQATKRKMQDDGYV